MLYDFQILDKKMDSWGFPKLKAESGFKIIQTDFEKAFKSGSIRFGDDGIYLQYDDKEYKGYMFIKEAYITYNGGPVKFPKFHLVKCQTIQKFIDTGKFKQRYEWSNSDKNDLTDIQTQEKHENIKLQLCAYCRQQILEQIDNTEDFFNTLDTQEIEETTLEVDIFGYDKNWYKTSKAYRKKANYTCENCGIKMENTLDRRFTHTHHIDGNKTNNSESNLQCLCVLCHSYINAKHEENFGKSRMQKEISSFIKKYRNELINVGNQYLKIFES